MSNKLSVAIYHKKTVHVFGSCLVNGSKELGVHPAHYKDGRGCSVRATSLGVMHHYLAMFYHKPEHTKAFSQPPHTEDEYSALISTLGSYAVSVRNRFTNQIFVFDKVPIQR
jgi:hypothetical protein